jgi:CRISPR-associated exonuclease Cas4
MLENEIKGVTGKLEYPKQRKTKTVQLTPEDVNVIQQWKQEIQNITQQTNCPPVVKKSYCKNCAYFDYCFV